ncbi:unnamed protein product [Diamesa serratosioi]
MEKKEIKIVNADEAEEDTANSSCENFHNYLLSSTLHGLHYIGTTTISVFERFFFGASFFMVTILAAYFISNVWQKWRETPIIIGLNPVGTNIKDIPYPAVTICNMNQVKKSFADSLYEDRDKSILDSICSQGDKMNNTGSAQAEGRWSYVREFLVNSSQSCDAMLLQCKFGKILMNCSDIFRTVLTDEGLCCTFNVIHPILMFKNFNDDDHIDKTLDDENQYFNWSPETGYDEKEDKPKYPRPVPGAGSHMGLSLILDANVSDYYCSSTSSSGFKVLLHSPVETPKMANYGFSVSTGLETKVVITPKISEASELIRKVPQKQRQCIFENEANLSYYNIYSRKNCEMECVSLLIEADCDCVLYYMPRQFNGSKICNRQKATCYEKVLFSIGSTFSQDKTCSCLPACYEINYGRELSSAKLGTGAFQTAENIFAFRDENYVRDNLAIIHIYFVDNAFGGFTKSELIGFTEFLSNTGGLLGLFMGFSVISLIEIIYFLSLRPFCAKKRHEKQHLVELQSPKSQFKKQNDKIRGANKSILIGHDYFQEKFRKEDSFKQRDKPNQVIYYINSALNYIKNKLQSVWLMGKDRYTNRKFNGQSPYPYYE